MVYIEKTRLYIILVNCLIFVFSDLVIRLELGTVMGDFKIEVRRNIDRLNDELISASLSYLFTRLPTWLFFLLDLIVLPSFFLSFITFTIFFSNS